MKKLLWAALAAFALVACNSKLGPEYSTGSVISNVTVNAVITPDVAPTVTAHIESQYGLSGVYVAYQLNDETENIKNTTPVYYTAKNTSVNFSTSLPKQEEGCVVKFQVIAYTPYGMVSASEVKSYTVMESTPSPIEPVE